MEMEMFPSEEEEAVALTLLELHRGSTELTLPTKALIVTTLIHSLIVGKKESRKEAAISLKTLLMGQQGKGEFHGFMMLSSSAKELMKTTIIHSLKLEEDTEILSLVIKMTSAIAKDLVNLTPEPTEIWPELREFIMAAVGDDRLGALRILESFDTGFPLARVLNMERFKKEVFLPILKEPFNKIKPLLFKGLKLSFLKVASFEGMLTYLHKGADEDLMSNIFQIVSSAVEGEEVEFILSAIEHICGLVKCTQVFNDHLDKLIRIAILVILSPGLCHKSKIRAMDILTWLPNVELPDEDFNGLWKHYWNVQKKECSGIEMLIVQKFSLLLRRRSGSR